MTESVSIASDITVHMKYARYLQNVERRENWDELTDRNMEMHMRAYPKLTDEINAIYRDYVKPKKVLPSMRSLQFGGLPIEVNNARLYNCAFLPMDSYQAFREVMFLLLSGAGVGFSVQKHHVETMPSLVRPTEHQKYVIGDSIEGWSDAINALVKGYMGKGPVPTFDFSAIREKGALLITSGGKAPGPEPLKVVLGSIEKLFKKRLGSNDWSRLRPIDVFDINCFIADAVLSGGIRRAALITLFSFDDEEMLNAKTGEWYKDNIQRSRSNNSVVFDRRTVTKEEFMYVWEILKNGKAGEPGFFFTDSLYWGLNPCAEIGLRPNQFCNLVEINGGTIKNQRDLLFRTRAAAFLGTLQAGYTDFHYLRPIWRETTERDALLGIGMTGIASGNIFKEGINLTEAALHAKDFNKLLSGVIGIRRAARVTTVKPSGTSSLVLGTSSGVHGWHDEHYIRRIRVGKNESIYQYLKIALPDLVEDDVTNPSQAVISLPQHAPEGAIMRSETAIQTLERVMLMYRKWVVPGHHDGINTHNVSSTINIRDEEWDEVAEMIWNNRHNFAAVSVLPYDGHTYQQAPFETITKEKYEQMLPLLREIDLTDVYESEDNTELQAEPACAGGICEIP